MVNIKVAVRIRPLSDRELLQGEEIVVRKENKSVVVVNPKIPERQDGDSRQRSRRFSVDFCYDPQDPEGCSQETVYKEIGSEVLDSILEGYNACVLAYGHSASGKTYTIMGLQDDPGLTPRLCEGLFQRAAQGSCHNGVRVEVAASFLEIYNEKVKDLLGSEETGAAASKLPLRVREHPKLGPYVQGLSERSVTDEKALLELLTTGNRKRSTAATENNRQSSRSHAVFTIHFRQSDGDKCETEKWSKVHLVDLAGSLQEVPQQETRPDERASSVQSKARLQEGANINKSLVTLGYVISALAESLDSSGLPKEHPGCKSWQPFVPYRDSVLTWLLKDTLGGNSNTIMIATISPASGCLSETVNTLRYAKRTKRIVNEAVVNEDPKVRTIRELRKEIERLKGLLVSFQSVPEEEWDKREIWQRWMAESVMRSEARKGGAEGGSLGGRRGSIAASPKSANDEKKSVVNVSANDTFSHESEIFSDSLESLGFGRGGGSCGGENEGEKSRRMHRSRPDLIKGISGHVKERPPSSSSQSCADVSNLSQSTSENSVTSSGSVEVAEAVTSRLYLTKKKQEQWMKVAENAGEVEESKLCKRARMKLFDLRRKLGMARRSKRTVDCDTQTDISRGTIRVKEKCVETDLDVGLDEKEVNEGQESAVESGTQTAPEEKSDKSANTSPTEVTPGDEESFSDDSLEGCDGDEKRERMARYCGGRDEKQKMKQPSSGRRDDNMSSDSSFGSGEGPEVVSSSDVSSEDFVFYENPNSGVEGTRERELYTITENSEQSDPGDAFSPVQSQSCFAEEGTRRSQSRGPEEGEKMGKDKKVKWIDWQSNSERQYLNLNVSSGRRSFCIDTNLFGKERSADGMFASADSVTLVLMGPAKPKSSVLMEIVRRSMGRNSLSGEAQRKCKSRGVQCDESLVRSVSVDMATIALSRIARNQHHSPNIVRATSLDGMDAMPPEEKPAGSQDATCKCNAKTRWPPTETPSPYQAANDLGRQNRQKKSVSWSGQTTYDSTPSEECRQTSPATIDCTVAPYPTDELTVFLKEAIHLLKKINSSKDVETHTDGRERRSERASDVESGYNCTWPRRRATAGKPPTGMKSRFGRSGRSESVQGGGFVDWTRSCQKATPGRTSWWSEETERRTRSYGDEDRWDKDCPSRTRTVFGAGKRSESCYSRVEVEAERDESREKMADDDGEWDGLVCEEQWEMEDEWKSWRKEIRKGMKRRKDGLCLGGCSCTASARDPCKHLLRRVCQSSFELDSFGPGSNHCHQMCMFCRKKDLELYSSALSLNSECVSDVCRLDYYGYCPCSSVRLSHVAWSPRAYMQHLLTLRRQIVGRTKALRGQPFSRLSSGYSLSSSSSAKT